MTPTAKARLKAFIAVVAWGGSLPSIKAAVAEVSFTTLIWLRFGTGVAALLLFLLLRGRMRLLPLREAAVFAGLGFLGVFFHNALQAFALKTVSAGMSGLIVAANPIAIALLGALILGERLDGRKKGGILLAAFGVLVILSKGDPGVFLRRGYSPGELLMVVSVFSWGLFSVFSRKALRKTSPELGMAYALSFGWLFATLPFLFSGGASEVPSISAGAWANILFLGVCCSALAYLFWYDALRELPASEAGVFLYINPVVAVLLSAAFLGETVTLSMIAGGVLVFTGVWFVNTKKNRPLPGKNEYSGSVESMKITASPLSGANVQGSGAIALYVFSGEPLPEGILSPGDVPAAAALLDDSSFRAKKGKIAKALLPGSAFSPLYLVGLGERKVFGEDSLRSSTAELVRRAKGDGVFRIFAHLPVSPDRNASCAVAEGAELGSYSFEKYKTRKDEDRLPEPGEFVLYGGDGEGLSLGKMLACAQNMARDLANEPGNRSNPLTLAEYALAEAANFGLEAEVWDEKKILEERMEGLYSVGMGSSTPPRLVRLSWKPDGIPLRKVVFVGKGITFDSGGLNLKPGDFIRSMKSDKSGACNVFALLRAAAKMKLPVEVHGIVALAENMPGGKAFRPDDILRMRNGKTVEIDNTDAEGRLVLADALSYASELRPDVIIDMATLTGACAVALGTSIAGLFTPDDTLAASLLEAGKARGERLWRLPDDDERIAESMKSPVADLVNSGSRYGGAIFAARFLREFVGEGISWAHLDIAGVDFNKDEYSVYGKGATGFAVRTCLQFLLSVR